MHGLTRESGIVMINYSSMCSISFFRTDDLLIRNYSTASNVTSLIHPISHRAIQSSAAAQALGSNLASDPRASRALRSAFSP
jgi:hypothetical protein